jgi:nucleoid-associated protein YgaU
VQAGDCLWNIAGRQLGPGATNAAIDWAWRSIYALNRAAIGDNPNLIRPGLTLTLPPRSATP